MSLQEYSLSEVANHNTQEDCWVVLNGKVLNVTEFLAVHPGGVKQIASRAGTDVTDIWVQLHDPEALNQLPASAHVGWLEGHAPQPAEDFAEDEPTSSRVVVLGHGPVAQNFVEALLKQLSKTPLPHSAELYHLTIFCEEIRPG